MDMIFQLNRVLGEYRIRVIDWFYTAIFTPYKVKRIRKKSEIRVLFVVGWLGFWRSEELYLKMLGHARFKPMILVVPGLCDDGTEDVVCYLQQRGLDYIRINRNDKFSIKKTFNPDIIFYTQPYDWLHSDDIYYKGNRYALFCYASYGMRGSDTKTLRDTRLLNIVWQNYYENNTTFNASARLMRNRCVNGIVTGLPLQNEYLKSIDDIPDPWKVQKIKKKRIIWAPHHSINPDNWLVYATFLQYAEFMKMLAQKYADKVQWAFKPHPLLYGKLCKVWGQERTDDYYDFWDRQEYSQTEQGKYVGLFMHSDGMIHDCGSFTIEYQYSGSPALYLIRDSKNEEDFNSFHQEAYDLHYKGMNEQDIENFVLMVINDIDPQKEARNEFIQNSLIPPNGGDACENILACILGWDNRC